MDEHTEMVLRRAGRRNVTDDVDGMVRQLAETVVDAAALDHQPDLGDSLPGNRRQLRVRVREGVPGQSASNRRRAVRHQPRRQPLVHADLLRAEKRADGGGGHRDRVGHDHLVRRRRLARLFYRWVAVAQGPYFVWVSIATTIQLSITAMNW